MGTENPAHMKPVTIDPEGAFNFWMTMDSNASLRMLADEMKERGIKCSLSTINKWSRRHNWVTRREMAQEGLDPARIHQHLKQIIGLANLSTDEVLHGCINSMGEIVVEAARTKPPEHVRLLADVMRDMIEMKREVRGALTSIEPPAPGPDPKQSNGKDRPANVHSLEVGSFRDQVVEGGKADG